MERDAPIRFSDDTREGRLQRFEQGLIDSDIEGIGPDPEGEAFVRGMIARGVRGHARIERIKDYLAARKV